MKVGERVVLGLMPRGMVARGFPFNHIYHHLGEMIVYLRATGNKVPGMYGPTYEESKKSYVCRTGFLLNCSFSFLKIPFEIVFNTKSPSVC